MKISKLQTLFKVGFRQSIVPGYFFLRIWDSSDDNLSPGCKQGQCNLKKAPNLPIQGFQF